MYEHSDFRGKASAIWPGSYDVHEMGISNDEISSARVPEGWVVELYEHSGLRGERWSLTTDHAGFGNRANDEASSIRVYRR